MNKTALEMILLALFVMAFAVYLCLGMLRIGDRLNAGQRGGDIGLAEAPRR